MKQLTLYFVVAFHYYTYHISAYRNLNFDKIFAQLLKILYLVWICNWALWHQEFQMRWRIPDVSFCHLRFNQRQNWSLVLNFPVNCAVQIAPKCGDCRSEVGRSWRSKKLVNFVLFIDVVTRVWYCFMLRIKWIEAPSCIDHTVASCWHPPVFDVIFPSLYVGKKAIATTYL